MSQICVYKKHATYYLFSSVLCSLSLHRPGSLAYFFLGNGFCFIVNLHCNIVRKEAILKIKILLKNPHPGAYMCCCFFNQGLLHCDVIFTLYGLATVTPA